MNYYNSNAAYDLANFAPAEQPETREPSKSSKSSKKASSAKSNSLSGITVAKFIVIGLFVMISVGAIMVGNIKLTRLSDQITVTQKQLNRANSEKVSLSSKLEARMSLDKVESFATNKLGLVKIQPYQISYVNLTNTDNVVASQKQPGVLEFFGNIINDIKEYFA